MNTDSITEWNNTSHADNTNGLFYAYGYLTSHGPKQTREEAAAKKAVLDEFFTIAAAREKRVNSRAKNAD